MIWNATRTGRIDLKPILVVQGVERALTKFHASMSCCDQAEIRCASGSIDELRSMLPGAEVMLGWNFAPQACAMPGARSTSLRWIHWAGAGVDAAMFDELVDSDIQFTNARGVFDQPMAEWVLGMIIAFAKRFPRNAGLPGAGRMAASDVGEGRRQACAGGRRWLDRASGWPLAAARSAWRSRPYWRSARDGDAKISASLRY